MQTRDGLYVQLRELQEQQRGISPKLSLWQTLEEQIKALKSQLGGQDDGGIVARRNLDLRSSHGVRLGAGRNTPVKCKHQRVAKCRVVDCTNKTRNEGRCSSCKRSLYNSYCRRHKGNH